MSMRVVRGVIFVPVESGYDAKAFSGGGGYYGLYVYTEKTDELDKIMLLYAP